MLIDVVIGANYGDEGKGLVTEFCCRRNTKPVVVLSNGGCQRGHTVNNVEFGIRHVFHHFGSGTLLGIPSIYSKTFLLNPIKYVEEKNELNDVGVMPVAFRAPSCILQLPGDMLTNQTIEKARAAFGKKHGSCGWGIWETQVRNAQHSILTFESFNSMDYESKKRCILDALEWQLENRLRGVYDKLIDWDAFEAVRSDGFCKHFINDFNEMANDVKCFDADDILGNDFMKHGIDAKSIVVENAQGLLLDMKYAPVDANGKTDIHSTPSKCGLDGALEALGNGISLNDVSTYYVSRTYFTRHGEGPFPEEDLSMKLDYEDKTNVFNEYQGSIRYGQMTYESFNKLKERTIVDAKYISRNLVFTHCNEYKDVDSLKDDNVYLSFEEDSRKIFKAHR